jgi:hypothetical protein
MRQELALALALALTLTSAKAFFEHVNEPLSSRV